MITTMTERKFYTQEDLLVAMSKLPEKEAENILENYKLDTMLTLINFGSEEKRKELQNTLSEDLRKGLDVYNGMNRLYDMLPVIGNKYYEKMEQENENALENRECTDVVENSTVKV